MNIQRIIINLTSDCRIHGITRYLTSQSRISWEEIFSAEKPSHQNSTLGISVISNFNGILVNFVYNGMCWLL